MTPGIGRIVPSSGNHAAPVKSPFIFFMIAFKHVNTDATGGESGTLDITTQNVLRGRLELQALTGMVLFMGTCGAVKPD